MIITITEIGKAEHQSKGKNVWSELPIKYDSDKKSDNSRKITSFSAIWEKAKSFEVGKSYEVTLKKNDKGYWDWVDAKESDGTPKTKPYSGGSGTNWAEKNVLDRERFEFDKAKQPLIVRQSSVSSAVEYFKLHGNAPTPEQVIEVAKVFEEYVYSQGDMKQIEVE